MPPITPREKFVLAVLALAVLVVWVVTFRGGHDWGGDFSLYIAHARNIAQGAPYKAVNFIVDDETPPFSPPTYPPLFPLLLAPVWAAWGLNYVPMKILVQVLWIISAVLLYIWARRRHLPPLFAGGAVTVLLLSGILLRLKDSVLSESTFMVMLAALLLTVDYVYGRALDEEHPVRSGLLVGLLLLLSFLARVNGLVFVLSFAACELYRSRRIRPFAVAAAAVFLAGFAWYRFALYDGKGYGNQFHFTPGIWASNIVFYVKAVASIWSGVPAVGRYPLSLALLGLAAWAIARGLRDRSRPAFAEWTVLLYMLPLLVYSSAPTARYMMPIFPLLLIFSAEVLHRTLRARAAVAGLAGVLAVACVLNVVAEFREPPAEGPEQPSFRQTVEWFRTNAAPDDTVICWNPRVLALYAGLPATHAPLTQDPERFRRYMDRLHVRWILTFRKAELDDRWVLPQIARHPDWRVAYQNQDFRVYRVN